MTDQPDAARQAADAAPDASRVEAAEAGVHHEAAETRAGVEPREHVTATDAVPAPHPHHHPDDPNVGVVASTATRGAYLGASIAVIVVIAAVIALAVAIGSA